MKSYRKELWLNVNTRRAYVNITSQVDECLRESGIREGLVLVNAMHITASVFINDDESGLLTPTLLSSTGLFEATEFSEKCFIFVAMHWGGFFNAWQAIQPDFNGLRNPAGTGKNFSVFPAYSSEAGVRR